MRRLRLLSGSVILHFIILSFLLTCVVPPGALAAPLVTITNPAVDDAGNCVVWGKTMVDVAYRGDRGAPIIKVVIYLDGSPQKEVKLSPPKLQGNLTIPFDFTLATGETHTIAAKAIDSTGGENSVTINVRVQKAAVSGRPADRIPPVIRIFYPAHGADVKGIISLKAEGQDNTGITSVVFYVDGKLHTMLVNAPPWETELNTRKLEDGPHVLSATAADESGNEGRSAEVTIIVQNKAVGLPMGTNFDPGVGTGSSSLGPIIVGASGSGENPPVIDVPPPAVAGLPGESVAAPRSSESAGTLLAAAPVGTPTFDPGYRTPLPGRAGGFPPVTPPHGAGLTAVPPGGSVISPPAPSVPSTSGPSLTPARNAMPPTQVAYEPPSPAAATAAVTGAASAPTLMGMILEPLRLAGMTPVAPARTVTPPNEDSVAMLGSALAPPTTSVPAGVAAAAGGSYGAQTAWDPAWGTPVLSICPARNGQPPDETRMATSNRPPPMPTTLAPEMGVAATTAGPSLQPAAQPLLNTAPAGARIGAPERVAMTPGMQPPPVAMAGGSQPTVADDVPTAIAQIRNIKIVFNGQQLDLRTLPALTQGISMTPLREIFEHTNGILYWYPQEKRVEAKSGQADMKLQIGNPQVQVNGEARTLALAPYIKQGRTMVPLQFVADTLNVTITFNPDSGQIVISSNEF